MKEKIRHEINGIIKQEPFREEKNNAIAQQLFLIPEFINSQNIFLYASLPDEVGTRKIIDAALLTKRVHLPIINSETKEIELGEAESFDELKKGYCGILEPTRKSNTDLSEIDLVIVPGRAFDERGHRIGRGGGYYDKLLLKTSCPKIALAFESQIIEEAPVEPHDIKVDKIVTETRVIICLP